MKIELKYGNGDEGIIYAKKAWRVSNNSTTGVMFSWNIIAGYYSYCSVEKNGNIVWRESSAGNSIEPKRNFSRVGDMVLDADLKEVLFDSRINKQKIKEMTMGKNFKNKQEEAREAIIKAVCSISNPEPEVYETDLESRESIIVTVYSGDGDRISRHTEKNKKKAKKYLQKPENIGKTIVVSEETGVYTTHIPVVQSK